MTEKMLTGMLSLNTNKEQIRSVAADNFLWFSIKTYVVGTHENHLVDMLWVLIRIAVRRRF